MNEPICLLTQRVGGQKTPNLDCIIHGWSLTGDHVSRDSVIGDPVSGKCLSGEPHIYLALKIYKSLKFAIQFLNFFDPIVLIVADVTIFWANMPYAYELMDFDRAGAAILPTAFLEVAQTLPKF